MFHDSYCNYSYPKNANHIYINSCDYEKMETIGQRILTLRLNKGYTQAYVGKKVGISRVSVTKWENGDTTNLKLDNLMKLCELFSVSPEYLITGSGAEIRTKTIYEDKNMKNMDPDELISYIHYLNSEVEQAKSQLVVMLGGDVANNSSLLKQSKGLKKNNR